MSIKIIKPAGGGGVADDGDQSGNRFGFIEGRVEGGSTSFNTGYFSFYALGDWRSVEGGQIYVISDDGTPILSEVSSVYVSQSNENIVSQIYCNQYYVEGQSVNFSRFFVAKLGISPPGYCAGSGSADPYFDKPGFVKHVAGNLASSSVYASIAGDNVSFYYSGSLNISGNGVFADETGNTSFSNSFSSPGKKSFVYQGSSYNVFGQFDITFIDSNNIILVGSLMKV